MSKPARPATVRFYVDADVLGLAKVLAGLRTDVTYPGDPGGPVKGGRVRPACPVAESDDTRCDLDTRDLTRAACGELRWPSAPVEHCPIRIVLPASISPRRRGPRPTARPSRPCRRSSMTCPTVAGGSNGALYARASGPKAALDTTA